MVVVALVNDDRDLRRIGRTFGRKITHDNPRVISYDTRNEIWACFGICIGKLPIAGRLARLVKRDIAFQVFTPAELFLIQNIHGVGETIVRPFELRIQIPAPRFIVGLLSCERRDARTFIQMYGTEGLARKCRAIACGYTLALVRASSFVEKCALLVFRIKFLHMLSRQAPSFSMCHGWKP